MNPIIYTVLLGATGALAMEIMRAWELRGKLAEERFKRIAASPVFWAVFVGMVLVSGLVTWAVFPDGASAAPLQLMLTGIGARGLLHGGAASSAANQGVTMGDSDRVRLKDIFQ